MEVIFYTEFSKRHNSTKNPESSGAISVGVTKEVNLKDNCDLISPSFFVADVNKYVLQTQRVVLLYTVALLRPVLILLTHQAKVLLGQTACLKTTQNSDTA